VWEEVQVESPQDVLFALHAARQELETLESIPQDVTLDPLIQHMIHQVDSADVYSMTGDLSGEWPATIGGSPYTILNRYTYRGAPIQHATQYVYEHFAAAGLVPSYHQWSGSSNPNVIGTRTGIGRPDEIVLITAHLDDVPDNEIAPGADDNASGSVGVIMAAEILSQYHWDCTLRFVTFTGEEQGLLGSDAYAQMAYNRGDNIVGVLNLDMIAYNSDAHPIIELHTRSGNAGDLAIANLFADVISTYSLGLSPQIEQSGISASDHYSFWQRGYSAILAIEDFQDFTPYYHTTGDRLDTLDMAYFTQFVKAAVGTFAHMGCLLGNVGTLEGTISDAATGHPLAATVTAQGGLSPFTTSSGASGAYSVTIPVDTYTVTAEATIYGYYPTVVTDVVVMTDTVTPLDLALEPYPRYVVSGTVRDATSGVPLSATVTTLVCPEGPCLEHTYASVSTDPATGFYSTTLISGPYTLRVRADGYRPITRAISVDRDHTQNFLLEPQGCVLLVDDDGGENAETTYQDDLNALGIDYTSWTLNSQGTPSLSTLEEYYHVLWLTGRRYEGTLTAADREVLADYLDGGGDLLLSSWGTAGDLDGNAFLSGYLHAGYNGDVVAGDLPLSGSGFMTGHPLTITTTADRQASRLTPQGGASAIYNLPSPYSQPAALAYEGAYGLVYLGFGLESAADEADRRATLSAALEWLGPCSTTEPLPPTSGFAHNAPVELGSPVVFTNTTTGLDPISYTLSFGDGTPAVELSSGWMTTTHLYTQVGTYTAWLTATNAGGPDVYSDTLQIVLLPLDYSVYLPLVLRE
jgi:hypothetical protein